MTSFIRDVLSVGLSKIIIIFFSLFTTIITARVLGPEKNGLISTLLVYPTIFLSFGSLGIRQSTTYLLGQKKYTEDEIKTGITQIWGLTSVISVVSCFFLMKYLSKSGDNTHLVLLALIPIPFALFNTYNSGIFLGKSEIKKFNQINWIPPFFISLFTALFLLLFNLETEGYLLALIGGPLSMFLILLFKNKFIQSFSLKFNFELFKSLIGLGLIYALSLLIINLNYKFDVIMLDNMSTKYQTGIYAKGASLIEFLWQIPMLLSTIVFSRSATSNDGLIFSKKVAQLMRISFVFIGIGSLALWLLSEIIIVGMFGNKFYDSILVLNLLLPGVVLLTIYKVMNMDLAGKGKPWIAIFAMLPALVVNILLNLYLIPIYGAAGAAFSSTISYSVAALLFLFLYSRTAKISVVEIISYKKNDFEPILSILKIKKSK